MLAAGACGKHTAAPPAVGAGDGAAGDAATPTTHDGVALPAASDALAAADAAPTVRIPDETTQLITAIVPDWTATSAELQLWRRDGAHGRWIADGPRWSGVIGRAGLAWGRGVHGDGVPAGRGGELKREGDGKSPAGLFAVGRTFGYAPAAPAGARVAYTPVDASWRCVDDPASSHYTQILDERTVTPDWSSAEHMRRDDALYAWVVEVRHNPAAVPGGGSCIFLHVWDGPADTTVGCTAMPEPTLAGVIARLDPAARPMVALLPRAEYDALAATWALPR